MRSLNLLFVLVSLTVYAVKQPISQKHKDKVLRKVNSFTQISEMHLQRARIAAAKSIISHADKYLLGVLGYNLFILFVFVTPLGWGFGLKERLMRWAAQSYRLRLWMRLAPVVALGMYVCVIL